jgi:hypothetical protein
MRTLENIMCSVFVYTQTILIKSLLCAVMDDVGEREHLLTRSWVFFFNPKHWPVTHWFFLELTKVETIADLIVSLMVNVMFIVVHYCEIHRSLILHYFLWLFLYLILTWWAFTSWCAFISTAKTFTILFVTARLLTITWLLRWVILMIKEMLLTGRALSHNHLLFGFLTLTLVNGIIVAIATLTFAVTVHVFADTLTIHF